MKRPKPRHRATDFAVRRLSWLTEPLLRNISRGELERGLSNSWLAGYRARQRDERKGRKK